MFEEKYNRLNAQVRPEQALIKETMRRCEGVRHVSRRRRLMVTVAAVLAGCMLLPAATAAVPAVYQTMYSLSPMVAQFFMPVERSCEKNGIEMTVQGIYIHDNMVEMIISMRDLTGNRIDKTTDLFDSYTIRSSFGGSYGCETLPFDEETQTASFRLMISDFEGRAFEGKKVTFEVREILTGKLVEDAQSLPIDLAEISSEPDMQTVEVTGGNPHYGSFRALVPGESLFSSGPIAVTGIAYTEGALHVQTRLGDITKADNHRRLYLRNRTTGEERIFEAQTDGSYYFRETQPNGIAITYCEDVIGVPFEKLAAYELCGDFVSGGEISEGPWRITFPVNTQSTSPR